MVEYRIKITGNRDMIVLSPKMIALLVEKIKQSKTKELVIPVEEILPPGYVEYLTNVMNVNFAEDDYSYCEEDIYQLAVERLRTLEADERQCFGDIQVIADGPVLRFEVETNQEFFIMTKQSENCFVCIYGEGEKTQVVLTYP